MTLKSRPTSVWTRQWNW